MEDNKSLIENISKEPLIDELKNMIHGLITYTGSEKSIELDEYYTILIDFRDAVDNSNQFTLNSLINDALAFGKSLILINVHNGTYLSKMLGIGFASKCIIVRPYDKYNVFNALGLYESDMDDIGQSHVVTQNTNGSRYFSIKKGKSCEDPICEWQSSFEKLCAAEQARSIESVLYSDFKVPQEISSQTSVSTPSDLPGNQIKLNYLVIESKWNLSEQQVTNNSIVMELALIASYNPKYKYLRIRSVGGGFNPANNCEIQYNNIYDRGYFQSNVKIHMEPNSDKLRILSTEPKNVHKQTQYTTSREFSIGVDISKNPAFRPAYTISESMTTIVSAFDVANKGVGITAHWDFDLAAIRNSIWDIFLQPFMRKGEVKLLPELATKNLQAITEAVWYAENTLNETIGFQLYWKVDHYHCWIEGNWSDYTQHYKHKSRTVGYQHIPVYIDFSFVYA